MHVSSHIENKSREIMNGKEGINTIASADTIKIEGEEASNSNKGIASFSSDNFSVGATTSGEVKIVTVDGGNF